MQVTQRFAQLLKNNVGKVIVGKDQAVELMMIAVLCRGHVLIEDVPGVGKTTLASALAKSLDCSFKRIQFTPDITPSDITGFSIANLKTGELEYRPGMIMSQIVLADEINRTSPKTQSSLLEVMEEGQVSVDGVTYAVPQPFIVLATQNPVDFVGTYPLPEAQLDRFFMRVSIGYPTAEEEADILERYTSGQRPMEELRPICTSSDIVRLQQEVEKVYSSREVRAYISAIAAASRRTGALQLGISTRAAISLLRAAQAKALLAGRDYVVPEDVQAMAEPVLAHRLVPVSYTHLAYFADLGCHADALLARTAAAQLAARGAAGVTYRDAEGIHVLGAAYRLEADAARIARQLSQREQLSAAVLELSAEPVSLRITAPEQDVQAIVDADSILRTQLKQIASMALQVDRGELSAESARTLAAVACSELDAARNQLEQIPGAAEDTVCAGLLFQLERLSGGLEAVSHGAERGATLSGRLRSCHVDGLLNRIEWLHGLT